MKEEELKPCPFCGGYVQFVMGDPIEGITGIFCHGCRSMTRWAIEMGPRDTYGENARKWTEKWNQRDEGS